MKTKLQGKHKIKKFNPDDEKDDAEHVYFGIEEQLKRIINPSLHKNNILDLQFNFDGLPLFNSSSKEFRPVLGKVYTADNLYKPFVIAVHCGTGKPKSVDNNLSEFIKELNGILRDGVKIDGTAWQIHVMCFICDRPARAYIKCIKGHTGFYSCERCTVKGYTHNKRTLFPVNDCNVQLRSNMSFRNEEQKLHHQPNPKSPLTSILPWIDMVPFDFMHLGCLGVMKKLMIEYWMKLSSTKLNREQILRISQRLMYFSNLVPVEFQRTTQSLGDVAKWKATEYRFLLLYCGMFVLKDVLPDDLYKHFLPFSIASRILCSKTLYNEYFEQAQEYLENFVQLATEKYGEDAFVLNMHSLIHLADDVKHFNCPLTDISAFPFENTLGKIKRYLESGNKPLAQLIRRLEEEFQFSDPKPAKPLKCKVLKAKLNKHREEIVQIQRLQYKDCELSTTSPNNVVLLENNDVLQISSMYSSTNTNQADKIQIKGRKLNVLAPGLTYPEGCSNLDIYEVDLSQKSDTTIESIASKISCKMVLLTIVELPGEVGNSYVLSMLHM